ncbi:hypothetical protein JTB14_023172 [Gonioctena quinquepunctata]|nr:hypothetical protein JTB14_023172 [Gonioctena quinquepunctata]
MVAKIYINSFGLNEEIDNDIVSTFAYCTRNASKSFRLEISKMVIYFSQFWSTYLETHYFISSWTGKSYPSILCGLKEFLSPENIRNFIGDDEYVKMFYIDLKRYLDKVPEKKEPSEDFYTEGGVKMLPKMFLKKLLWIVE